MDIKDLDEKTFEREGLEWGSFNTFPEPAIELTPNEAKLMLHCSGYTPQFHDYKQAYPKGVTGGPRWDCTFYIWSDSAIAVCHMYTWDKNKEDYDKVIGKGEFVLKYTDTAHTNKRYAKRAGYFIRYYKLGCVHPNMYELGADEVRDRKLGRHGGMFDHWNFCPDCEYVRRYDSSG